MKKLGERNYTLILQAVRCEGSYDPSKIFCYFEESLYIHEADTIYEFLQWIVDGEMEERHGIKYPMRAFGHGNYEERFKEFLKQRK